MEKSDRTVRLREGREGEGRGRAKDTAAACVTSIPVDKEAKVNGGKGREREGGRGVSGWNEW